MFMEVDDKVKIAYYWFSKEEKDDKELRESLRPEYRQWNQKGYKVVNFLSGNGRPYPKHNGIIAS